MRERVIDKSVHVVTEYTSIQGFMGTDTVPAGIITIWEGGLPIDLLVSPIASDTTVFFFHGAIERHFTLPVLSGLGISGDLNANRVFVSDPSLILDENLMLAWYAGNSKQPRLQDILSHIFKKIADSLQSQKIIFFGGSGGGFAALYFASQFDDSLALVFNPQTNIHNYAERAVQDFATKAFGASSDLQAPLAHLPPHVVVDVCQTYKVRRNTTVAYLQNQNDTEHVQAHLFPFTQAIHDQTPFLLLKEPWNKGHSPPPKELLMQALNLSVSSRDWHRSFKDLGFTCQ
jgi:hypothetical protein